jgi:hypothetical protein
MLSRFTKQKKRLPFVPALVMCAAAVIFYQIFKCPELDRRIGKVMGNLTKET